MSENNKRDFSKELEEAEQQHSIYDRSEPLDEENKDIEYTDDTTVVDTSMFNNEDKTNNDGGGNDGNDNDNDDDDDYYDDDDDEEHVSIPKAVAIVLGSVLLIGLVSGAAYFGYEYFVKGSDKTNDKISEAVSAVKETESDLPATPTPEPAPTATPEPTPSATPTVAKVKIDGLEGKDVTYINSFIKINKLTGAKLAYESSDTVKKNYFIRLSTKKTEVERDEAFTIYISSGKKKTTTTTEKDTTNKTETTTVKLADLSSKTYNEAVSWLEDNNLKYERVEMYSDSVEKDKVVKMEPGSGEVKKDSTVKLYVSIGKVELPNATGKEKNYITSWIETANKKMANLKYEFVDEYSDSVSKDYIVSLSAKDGNLKVGSTIVVTMSKGARAAVVDHQGKAYSELEKYASANGFVLKVTKRYSSVSKDTVISQSPNSGKTSDKMVIYAEVSLGAYSVPDLKGKTYGDVTKMIDEANDLGAGISLYKETAYSSTVEEGKVISYVVSGRSLTVTVSLGEEVIMHPITSLVGMSYEEAINSTMCQQYFECNFTGEIDDELAEGVTRVNSQNPSSGEAKEGSTINLYYSYAPEYHDIPSITGMIGTDLDDIRNKVIDAFRQAGLGNISLGFNITSDKTLPQASVTSWESVSGSRVPNSSKVTVNVMINYYIVTDEPDPVVPTDPEPVEPTEPAGPSESAEPNA